MLSPPSIVFAVVKLVIKVSSKSVPITFSINVTVSTTVPLVTVLVMVSALKFTANPAVNAAKV